jgi:hypothetical protein
MKRSVSFYALIVMVLIAAVMGKNLKKWKDNKIIDNDVISYYAYLPPTFIYHDLSFEFTKNLPPDFEGKIWTHKADNGTQTLKMTMGLSVLWAPLFLLAHGFAHLADYPSNGYSTPYSIAILVAAIIYLFIGLWFLRKILLKYFGEWPTTMTLITLVLGTNLLHYVVVEPGMSHVYSFALFNLFLFLCLKWLQEPTYQTTIFTALVAGLLALIRPVNGIVILIPALLIVFSKKSFNINKLGTKRLLKMILQAGFVFFLMLLPQLIYWKQITGHWLYYSYNNEGFFFSNPQIINGLFSYRKGWLINTPIMIFAFTGFAFIKEELAILRNSFLVFLILFLYVVFSWWCWWYGGSYGSRPMIDIYGMMAIGLAAFIYKITQTSLWSKISMSVVFVFFIYLNIYQMGQYRTSLLHWDSMTKQAYWEIMFKTQWPADYAQKIKTPDYEKAIKGEKEYNPGRSGPAWMRPW